MPGANQILNFAQGGGANVLNQAAYLADAQRVTGNQTGIARAALVNKAALQSSAIAAGVAEFLANNQTADVTDQLTPTEIAAMFLLAMSAQFPLIATNLTIHVNSVTGNDATGDGSLALPYKTMGKAIGVAQAYTIISTAITISPVGDFSAEPLFLNFVDIASVDDYGLKIIGDTVTPANVKLGLVTNFCSSLLIDGCDLTAGLECWQGEVDLDHYRAGGVIQTIVSGALISAAANATFYGNHVSAFFSQGGHIDVSGGACSGNPVYTAFAVATMGGTITFNGQPTGAATGSRYNAQLNGVINTNGGGASYLPGSTAGATATGAQYA